MKKEIKKEVTVLVEKVKTPKKVEKTVTPKKRKSVLIQPTLTVSTIEVILFGFFRITYFLERILMKHIDMENSLDTKLQVYSICSIRICPIKLVILKKLRHNFNYTYS